MRAPGADNKTSTEHGVGTSLAFSDPGSIPGASTIFRETVLFFRVFAPHPGRWDTQGTHAAPVGAYMVA